MTLLPTTAPPPVMCAENVGAISITGVASRRVTQAGALIMILVSVVGKIGALFASIPQAVSCLHSTGGERCCTWEAWLEQGGHGVRLRIGCKSNNLGAQIIASTPL